MEMPETVKNLDYGLAVFILFSLTALLLVAIRFLYKDNQTLQKQLSEDKLFVHQITQEVTTLVETIRTSNKETITEIHSKLDTQFNLITTLLINKKNNGNE